MYCKGLIAAGLCFAISCSRPPAATHRRLAIVRFENLGADPSTDWMGRAFSEVLTYGLAEAPGIYAIPSVRLHALDRTLGARPIGATGISAERAQALAAGADRIGYGTYAVAQGRLEAALTIVDTRTGKATVSMSVTVAPPNVEAAAAELARHISNRIVAFPTASQDALRDYAGALEAADADAIASRAGAAVAADPNFGPAYRMLADSKAGRGDRAGALADLDAALARAAGMPPAEQARIRLDKATLQNDTSGQLEALASLAKASPADPDVWRTYARTAQRLHAYPPAEAAFRQALAVEPDDVDAWNGLAYAAAYSGDLNGAVAALRQYRNLRPGDPNPLDSLGDAHLIEGRLREAEGFYLEAATKNPAFLSGGDYFKAAMARLMTGDVSGADAICKQFTDFRAAAKDPAVALYQAQWNWLSGRRAAASRDLESFAAGGPPGDLAARAWTQLAIWRLVAGDRAAASRMAAKAGVQSLPAVMANFLAQPPGNAAEWTARAGRLAPRPEQGAIRDFALGYALLGAKEYAAASVVLRRMYESGEDSSDEGLPVLLAWSYLETGRDKDAAGLLAWNPIPPAGGPNPFMPFYFPRLFLLRADAAAKAGRKDEEEANRRIYRQLSSE